MESMAKKMRLKMEQSISCQKMQPEPAKVPIALIVDDSAPCVHIYYEHAYEYGGDRITASGEMLKDKVPNSLMIQFCEIIKKYGMRGNFTIVPMPGGRGNIVEGIDGFDDKDVYEWLDMVRNYVTPNFTISPEMLTHAKAVDLNTSKALEINECEWSMTQNTKTLIPYIEKALEILKEAGFNASGVTSPWSFGSKVEEDYVAAIASAMWNVYGKKDSWYFLHQITDTPGADRPWIAYNECGCRVISIPTTVEDYMWDTIDVLDSSAKYVSLIADKYLTVDGKQGAIIDVINGKGFPILCTHWTSLFSNGRFTGIRILEEIVRRVNKHLLDKVQWMACDEIMELIIEMSDDNQ